MSSMAKASRARDRSLRARLLRMARTAKRRADAAHREWRIWEDIRAQSMAAAEALRDD